MCQRTVAWALDDAPVPAELLGTLVAIARRCAPDGTGSYQSKSTLVAKTGKSKDQVDADVSRLLDLGLIRLGDQTLPERNGVPPGRRPVVYDVALEMRGPKPRRAGRNRTGKNSSAPATGGMDTTGGTDTGGGTDTPGTGGMDTGGTGGMDTPATGGTDTPQTTHGNNPNNKTFNNPSLCAVPPSPPAEPERETGRRPTLDERARAEGWRLIHDVRGYPPPEARHLIDELTRKHRIVSPQWWRTAHGNGSLDDRIGEVIADYQATHSPAGSAPTGRRSGRGPYINDLTPDDYRTYAERSRHEQEPAA
ncbi:hypothetical protein C1I95_17640 [Micromonospora craterilacus]|uniref:Helix-turn-helix domain-containing protein n=1 Tax=Micromonospora craterilacus TaxID=1655439 RepID=A0A2W2FN67_9ACTN|nr:hypothetical protein C1I95_17640 [Micromonospora craterilacus]